MTEETTGKRRNLVPWILFILLFGFLALGFAVFIWPLLTGMGISAPNLSEAATPARQVDSESKQEMEIALVENLTIIAALRGELDTSNQMIDELEAQLSELQEEMATLSGQMQQDEDVVITEEILADTQSTEEIDGWDVMIYEGFEDHMQVWLDNLEDLAPESWPEFPNVDNPNAGFEAVNGLEYGLDERNYCPQETCDIVVAARGYNLITADYDLGWLECHEMDGVGCALMLVNVGDVSSNFEEVVVNNGFSVSGRYWNGDQLHQVIIGALSNASANMMNLATNLNFGGTNAEANCSVPGGCTGVLARFVVLSGNEVIILGETTIAR